jgi:hypothetical protein
MELLRRRNLSWIHAIGCDSDDHMNTISMKDYLGKLRFLSTESDRLPYPNIDHATESIIQLLLF